MQLPGLAKDIFTPSRKASGTDSEGNAWGTWEDLGTRQGTWGTVRARDLSVAAKRGEQVQSVISTASYADALPGDRIDALHGKDWTVVAVEPLPGVSHVRVMLREVD